MFPVTNQFDRSKCQLPEQIKPSPPNDRMPAIPDSALIRWRFFRRREATLDAGKLNYYLNYYLDDLKMAGSSSCRCSSL